MPPVEPQPTPELQPAPAEPVVPQQPQPIMPTEPVMPAQPMPFQQQPAAPAKKRFPKWLLIVGIVVGILLVLIVVAVVVATLATKAPQKVSDAFVNDIQANNTTAAYAITSSTFKQAASEAQLAAIIKQVSPEIQGQEKVSGRYIQKSTSAPETAVLVYTVPTASTTAYLKVELQKNNSVWQVLNFRSSNSPLNATVIE